MAETKTNIPIEIKMGNAGTNDTNLPAFKEGSIIFTKDTKKIYIDPVGETERIAVGGTEVDLSGKQDKFGTVSYASSPKYLMLSINGYVDPTSGKFIKLSPSDIRSTRINVTNADFLGKVKFEDSLIMGNTGVSGFDFELPTATTPGIIKTSNPGLNKLNFSNGLGTSDIQLGGIKNGTADNDAVNVSQLNGKLDKQETRQYEGQPSQEHAQLGTTEILTAQTGTWVTDGWTGDATTGFTHTSGNTSILKYPITGSDYIAEGTLYDITFSCSVAPTVDNIMVRIGNSNLFNLYGQEEPLNIGVKSKGSTDGTIYLEFIPSSTFTGTISNIKVHKITGTYVGKYKITDSNDSISFEVRANTVNKYNAFIGVDSGSYNTTGNGNVGFGYKALASNTSGFWNTGIGFEALQFVNAGSRNIGIGALAGRHIETGQRNVAIGTHTFRENRTGNNNIAIGADSQINGKSGNNNISIGVTSLSFIEGDKNIAIGRGAMAVNSGDNKGTSNIAIGENSLSYGSNTKGNIAIGEIAGYKISGNYNVAIGGGACRNGSNQVVVGYNSGNKLEADAFGNTILGTNSGNNLKSNRFCILIGNTISGEETGDYQLNIGNLIKGSTQSSNKYVNIDGSLSAKNMSVDNVGTNDTDVVNKKYVDDAIAAGGGSGITIDSELSGTSTNPVQNKVINSALSNKLDKFTQLGGVQWNGLLYGVQDDGQAHSIQKMFDLCASAIKDTVVLRNNKGEILCETPTNNVTDKHAVNIGYLTTKYGSTNYRSQDKEFYLPSQSNLVIPNAAVGRLFMGPEGVRSTDFKIYVNDPIDGGKLIITNLKTPTNDEDAVNKKYVDDIKTELLKAINHPYTYDETTKELTLIL